MSDKGSITIHKDENIEVRVKRDITGIWKTWIKNLKTGVERMGPNCPGDPNCYNFNLATEVWSLK